MGLYKKDKPSSLARTLYEALFMTFLNMTILAKYEHQGLSPHGRLAA